MQGRLLLLPGGGDGVLPKWMGLHVNALHPSKEHAGSENLPPWILLLSRSGDGLLPQWVGLRIDALHQAPATAEPVICGHSRAGKVSVGSAPGLR